MATALTNTFRSCFEVLYLFGLRRPHEHLQSNRCVKRERTPSGCVCATRNSVPHQTLALSVCLFCLLVSSSSGLRVLFLQLSRFSSLSVSLGRSLSLLSTVKCVCGHFRLFVYEVRNAIWLFSHKTGSRGQGCEANLLLCCYLQSSSEPFNK